MRVALDATPLTAPPGGIRRYTAELSAALAREFPDDEFLLASDQGFRAPVGPANLKRLPGPRGRAGRRWWSLGLPAALVRGRISVFHGTDFAVPYLRVKPAVMTLHDLSPWRAGPDRDASRRVRRRTPWLLRLGLADLVITPTEAVAREAVVRFGVEPDRIRVVPEAAAAVFYPEPEPPARRFVLSIGAPIARKNLGVLVEAWRAARRRHEVDLVLAGPRQGASGPVPEPGLVIAGEVSDGELRRLYSTAAVFAYPSTYEGFGLPVLEAMQCGAPVVASRIPAIQEVAGEAALLVEPGDAGAWAEALSAMLENPERRQALVQASLERAAQFDWARTARETMAVYREAIGRFGR